MLRYIYLLISVFILYPFSVCAESNSLPEPMVGQTTVMVDSGGVEQKVFYDGMGSNQVILTTDPNANLIQYDRTVIENCRGVDTLPNPARCFSIVGGDGVPIKNMTSRTSRDGNSELEISALIYSPNIIQGDAYSNFDSSNFAFYGRNLNQTQDNTNSPSNGSWNTPNYTFNPDAQSSYSSTQLTYLKNRVTTLAGEAKETNLSQLSGDHWYLQGKNGVNDIVDDSDRFPEGKVWLLKNSLTLTVPSASASRTVTIHGRGTIIFLDDANTSLTLSGGLKIVRALGDESSSLGIIVANRSGSSISDDGSSLNLAGNNAVDAAVLVFGDINKTGNGNFEGRGSFVANGFSGFGASNGFSKFSYDYKLDENWPPGFRFFNMPTSENSSPN